MRTVEMEKWPRRQHFKLFRGLDFPYFSLTTEVEVSVFRNHLRKNGTSFNSALVYALSRVANEMDEFKTRIRGDQVVLHERIDPSFTVPWKGDLFNFCTVEYEREPSQFIPRCLEKTREAETSEHLILDEPGRDDFLFLSCLPWVHFSSMTHPVNVKQGDSVPRIAWGKIRSSEGRELLPLNFQLHHALADGVHIGRFVERLTGLLERPDF